MVERNVVVGTRADPPRNDPTRDGVGLFVSYQSEAELQDNELAANPVAARSVRPLADQGALRFCRYRQPGYEYR